MKNYDPALHDSAINVVKERLASIKEGDESLIEAIRMLDFLDEMTNIFSLHIGDLESAMDESGEIIAHLKQILDELKQSRRELLNFIDSETEHLSPNLKNLAGSLLAARLIFAAGGMHNLAKMPSSTIQVLGAKKSLFKHLRRNTPPPKHGLISQHPLINTAPKNKRGKLARILAGKLAIAVRIDYYSEGELREDLERDLNKRISRV
ncbi:MAG: putative NOP5 family protein [Candidatus Syntrophoarchaeum sp. GoM_oil]|nr:MAG: putative NOP5 family protein [Candidatus Syntrophoarchaeum sp. GoM_oil]